MLARVAAYFRDIVRRNRIDCEIAEELRFHLESEVDANISRGMSPGAARRAAIHDLGGLSQTHDAVRDVRTRWLDAAGVLRQDLRYAIRVWTKRPGFTVIAILVLGFGIASTTSVFSLVNAVLLHSLPFADPDRLVLVWQQDLSSGRDRITLSPAEYVDYSTQSRSFESIGAVRGVTLTAGIGDTASAVDGVQVSRTLFDTLGVRPVMGRAFTVEEEAPGRNHVALLTYEFWQRAFGGDRDVLGHVVTLRSGFTGTPADAAQIDGPHEIIGVLPPRTSLLYRSADIWIPLALDRQRLVRTTAGLIVFARLKASVSLGNATTDVAAIARRLADLFPERSRGVTAWLVTLRTEDSGDITPTLMLLSASVTLLSLIVCTNVGNMLLGGLTERHRELSVRCALGASRARVVRQLLTESAVLTAGGAVVGIVVSAWQLRALAHAGPQTIPRVTDVSLDGWALAVALVTAAVMTALFALVPAATASRTSGVGSQVQRAGNVAATARLRELIVIAEIALAVVVLVGTGLVIESAAALERTRLGYDPQHVLTFRTALPYAKYSQSEKRAAFYRDVLDRLRSLPTVSAAGAVSILPQMDTNANVQFELDDRSAQQAGDPFNVRFRIATTGYFKSLGAAVLEGRDFDDSDLSAGAIIISRSMRQRYWPNTDPIGHRLHMVRPGIDTPWLPIVGVVDDVRQWVVTPGEPTIYWASVAQPTYAIAVRTVGDPQALVRSVRETIRQVDSAQPVFDVRSQDDRLRQSQQFAYGRFRMTVMAVFGAATLLLAALGVYGVVRYSVARRVPEFGIRIALGASPVDIVRMVVAQSARAVVLGMSIGTALSWALGRVVASVLYGVAGTESRVIALVALVLALTTIAAAVTPARRAGLVDPLDALRAE